MSEVRSNRREFSLCEREVIRHASPFRGHLHLLAPRTSLHLSVFLFPTHHSLFLKISFNWWISPSRADQNQFGRRGMVLGQFVGPTRPRSCPRHPDFIPLGLEALRAFAHLFYSPATSTAYATNYASEICEQSQRQSKISGIGRHVRANCRDRNPDIQKHPVRLLGSRDGLDGNDN